MKLKSFKTFFGLLILFFLTPTLNSEEKIDIWKNKNNKKEEIKKKENSAENNDKKLGTIQNNQIETNQVIKIDENFSSTNEIKVYGIYDPSKNNFDLNMWTTTDAEDVKASIKRLKKIKLSDTSNDILENILMSFSYPPKGMNDDEFVRLKINWLLENDRFKLIENFLKQNNDFDGKKLAVQFLVDQNIAQANIKKGCEKIEFIDTTIKDSYLEKFKIYCLVFNNKNSQARLLLNLLREQKQSDNFFDDKINYLLGISEKTTNKINEKNLLNF